MLRSRMLPDGFKLFFGLSVFALFGALILGIGSVLRTTDGLSAKDNLDRVGLMETITGPISVGWKGGVGNHLGYVVLFGTFLAAGFLAFLLVAFRDADPEAEAEVLHLDSVPLTRAPAGQNFSPLVAVAGVGLAALGLIKGTIYIYAGGVVLVLAITAWAVRAWAERATGDDEVNAQIYHRIIDPLRVPILGALIIAFIVGGISRIFISADTKEISTAIFLGLGLALFVVVAVIGYFGEKVAKPVIAVFLTLFALVVLAFGIYGVNKGDRKVEPHEGGGGEHTTEPAGEGGGTGGEGGTTQTTEHEGGLAPIVVGAGS